MGPTHQPLSTRKNAVCLSAAFYYLLWGSAYPTIKGEYEVFQITTGDIPPKIVFTGYRFPFVRSLLPLLAIVRCEPIGRLSLHRYGQLTLLGLTQTSLRYIFFYTSLTFTTGTKGPVISTTGTFFGVLLAYFIYHNDKLGYNRALGCILGLTGVAVMNSSSGMGFSFSLLGGDPIMMAVFILSAVTLYGKRVSQTVGPTVMTGYQLGGGDLALVIDGYAFGGMLTVHGTSSMAIPGYLMLLPSVAFALWSILLEYNRVGTIAPSNFLIPASGIILSAVLLGESVLKWKCAVTLVLVCSGIWWMNKVKR